MMDVMNQQRRCMAVCSAGLSTRSTLFSAAKRLLQPISCHLCVMYMQRQFYQHNKRTISPAVSLVSSKTEWQKIIVYFGSTVYFSTFLLAYVTRDALCRCQLHCSETSTDSCWHFSIRVVNGFIHYSYRMFRLVSSDFEDEVVSTEINCVTVSLVLADAKRKTFLLIPSYTTCLTPSVAVHTVWHYRNVMMIGDCVSFSKYFSSSQAGDLSVYTPVYCFLLMCYSALTVHFTSYLLLGWFVRCYLKCVYFVGVQPQGRHDDWHSRHLRLREL